MAKALKRAAALVMGLSVALIGLAAPALAQGTINQRLTIYFDLTNNPATVIASGPVSGRGSDIVVSDSTDRYVFSDGSVRVVHQATSSNDSFNPTNCSDHFTQKGTYQLTGGTGRYAGVSGSGTYSLDGTAYGRRTPSGCSFDSPTGHGTISAAGQTSLPV